MDDKKYRYVILTACFLISLIIDGTLYAFGATKNYIQEHYNGTESRTSAVGSVANGIYLISGPIAAISEQRFGCRITTILGSVTAAVAMCLSTFSPSLAWMTLIYGCIGGLGFGFAYLPVITAVAKYFKENQALAMGINVAGSGMGSIVFAPFASNLYTRFGWKIGMYILASLMLICVIAGIFLRDPVDKLPVHSDTEKNPACDAEILKESGNQMTSSKNFSNSVNPSQTALLHAARTSNDTPNAPDAEKIDEFMNNELNTASVQLGSCHEVSIASNDRVDRKKAVHFRNTRHVTSGWIRSIWKYSGFDLCLKDMRFALICLGNVFSMIGYYVPYIFLASLGEFVGMSRTRSSYLISVLGIFNTISRPGSGLIVQNTPISALTLNNIGLAAAAIVTFPISLYGRNGLFAYAALFGLTIAPHVSMTPVFLNDLYGQESVAKTYGMIMFFRGITSTVSPIICGKLTEITKSFNTGFLFGAASLMASSVIHGGASLLHRKRRKPNSIDSKQLGKLIKNP